MHKNQPPISLQLGSFVPISTTAKTHAIDPFVYNHLRLFLSFPTCTHTYTHINVFETLCSTLLSTKRGNSRQKSLYALLTIATTTSTFDFIPLCKQINTSMFEQFLDLLCWLFPPEIFGMMKKAKAAMTWREKLHQEFTLCAFLSKYSSFTIISSCFFLPQVPTIHQMRVPVFVTYPPNENDLSLTWAWAKAKLKKQMLLCFKNDVNGSW